MEFFEKEKNSVLSFVRENAHILVTALAAGFAAYGFMMFNVINSWDNAISAIGGFGSGIELGRWFLELLGSFAGSVWGNYSIPAFNVALSVLLLSVAACLLVRSLGIENRALAAAVSAIFVTFPTVGGTVIYTFTVHYYALAVLLAVWGVYIVGKRKGVGGVLLGGVLFAFSMGIYQAYLPLAASLFVLMLMRMCAVGGKTRGIRDVLCGAVRFLSSLAVGAALYLLLLAVFRRVYGVGLSDYQGIGDFGAAITALPRSVVRAYDAFFAMMGLPFSHSDALGVGDTTFIRAMFAVSALMSALMIAFLTVFTDIRPARKALLILFAALLPLAGNSVMLMAPNAYIHLLMMYGAVSFLLAPVVMFEAVVGCRANVTAAAVKKRGKALASASFAVILSAAALSSVNYVWQSNGNYMLLYYTNEQTTEYFSSLVTRIRSAEGYDDALPVAVIGDRIADEAYFNGVYAGTPFRYTGTERDFLNIYSRTSWMSLYLGFAPTLADAVTTEALAASDEVRAMPCYPDDGSVRVIDGVVVVKLSEPE